MATIYKRGEVWYSLIRIDGKRIRKPLGKNKALAQVKLAQMIQDKDAFAGGSTGDMSLETFYEQKYLPHRKATTARNTYYNDRRGFEILKEEFPTIQNLSQVTPELLDRMMALLKERKTGAVNGNRILKGIKTAMRKAEAWDFRLPGKWNSVSKFKEPRGKLLFYSMDELMDLFKFCHDHWLTIAILGSRLGLRRSEMYWLSWDDVDFIRSRVHIVGKEGWQPKDYQERWVPWKQDVGYHLSSLPKSSRWVLGNDRPIPGSMTTYFKRISKKAKLKGNIHTLRHTYASHLAQAGVDLYTIKELLGHDSIETTQIYAHLCPESHANAIKNQPDLPMPISIENKSNNLYNESAI